MNDLINLIEKILSDKENRINLIKDFQQKISNINIEKNENFKNDIFEILNELAYDMDFYESNPKFRKEDPSYYGEERLRLEIKEALEKIHKLTQENS